MQRLTGVWLYMPEIKPATTTSHRRLQVLALLASADGSAAVPRFHT